MYLVVLWPVIRTLYPTSFLMPSSYLPLPFMLPLCHTDRRPDCLRKMNSFSTKSTINQKRVEFQSLKQMGKAGLHSPAPSNVHSQSQLCQPGIYNTNTHFSKRRKETCLIRWGTGWGGVFFLTFIKRFVIFTVEKALPYKSIFSQV